MIAFRFRENCAVQHVPSDKGARASPHPDAWATFLDSAKGYRLVGRQEELKAGGPAPTTCNCPAHEGRSGNWLEGNPCDPKKFPIV
jgi:hypothetical protein